MSKIFFCRCCIKSSPISCGFSHGLSQHTSYYYNGKNSHKCNMSYSQVRADNSSQVACLIVLKGTATLMMTLFYMKDLNKQWIFIPVSSKSDEKHRSCGRLNICKWTVMEAAIFGLSDITEPN